MREGGEKRRFVGRCFGGGDMAFFRYLGAGHDPTLIQL